MEIITTFNNNNNTSNFNNNLGEQQLQQHLIETNETFIIETLAKCLENELRTIKHTHFLCNEILLPNNLIKIISKLIYKLSDDEPYGLKGCRLFINFQNDLLIKRNLTIIHCDHTIPTTFELYLTLKQVNTSWNSFLPQFLKKMTRGNNGTVVISNDFDIEKKKLYRSCDE